MLRHIYQIYNKGEVNINIGEHKRDVEVKQSNTQQLQIKLVRWFSVVALSLDS